MSNKYPFIYNVTIAADSLIAPYNHVHHADILKILESARGAFLDFLGYPLQKFLDRGLFWVIAELDIRYMREVKAGSYQVTCEFPEMIGKRLLIPQKIINEKNKLAAQANIQLMLFDVNKQRAIVLDEQLKSLFFQ